LDLVAALRRPAGRANRADGDQISIMFLRGRQNLFRRMTETDGAAHMRATAAQTLDDFGAALAAMILAR